MTKPRSILADMPWNVKKMIIESTDTKTKISLRQTTKSLKHFVDNSTIQYHEITLQSHGVWDSVIFGVNITPQQTPVDFRLELANFNFMLFWVSGKIEKELSCANSIELLAQKFTKVFRNPRAIVKTLEIEDFKTPQDANSKLNRELIMSTIGTHLSRLPHKINVECLKFSAKDQHDLRRFLSYIKPGVLKTIHLKPCDKRISRDFPLNTVAGMEQWKKARCLVVNSPNLKLSEKDTKHFDDIYCALDIFGLEQTKSSIETILNGATKRSYQAKQFDYDAITSYLDQFENLSKRRCKEFKIRRGAASCNVRILDSRYPIIVVFYNPEKTSVGTSYVDEANFFC